MITLTYYTPHPYRAARIMSSPGPITRWIGELKDGNLDAARPLWEHFFHRLVALARRQLHHAPRAAADEEDVALSVLDSFVNGARRGAFPDLTDREELWRLLVVKTIQKSIDHRRREGAEKRGGGRRRVELTDAELKQALDRDPTPELAAEFVEECQLLLAKLPEDLRQLAVWRMEGHTVEEIASRLNCVDRTVKRRLRLIRSLWDQEGEPRTTSGNG
jgi:DNA-directed RNA polymerase specialized sigma24 family protein